MTAAFHVTVAGSVHKVVIYKPCLCALNPAEKPLSDSRLLSGDGECRDDVPEDSGRGLGSLGTVIDDANISEPFLFRPPNLGLPISID